MMDDKGDDKGYDEGMIDFKLFGGFAPGQMVQVHVNYMKIQDPGGIQYQANKVQNSND